MPFFTQFGKFEFSEEGPADDAQLLERVRCCDLQSSLLGVAQARADREAQPGANRPRLPDEVDVGRSKMKFGRTAVAPVILRIPSHLSTFPLYSACRQKYSCIGGVTETELQPVLRVNGVEYDVVLRNANLRMPR